jgi:hypothetical protein
MRRWLIVVGAFAILATTAAFVLGGESADAAELETTFVDDNWSTHETSINALAAAGITKGCNPPVFDRYCPARLITRGEMAAFLVRSFGYTERGTKTFIDDDASIFEADIEKVAAAGVTVGCNPPINDRFCPNDRLTRAQMATLLARALELQPRQDGRFVDIAGSVHAQSINAIAAIGVTKGCNPPANDRYCPGEPVTRAQMASFLARALGLDPVYNQISMRPGASCTRDQTVCTTSFSLPAGRGFGLNEGWHHAVPFSGDEETAFRAGGTLFEVTVDGQTQPTTASETSDDGLVTRRWTATVSNLTPGAHTLRGTWRWDGTIDLTVIMTVYVG